MKPMAKLNPDISQTSLYSRLYFVYLHHMRTRDIPLDVMIR